MIPLNQRQSGGLGQAATSAAADGEAPRAFRVASTLLLVGITLTFGVVLARVAQLQLRPSPELIEAATPRVSVKRELPLRGDITDRRGRLLAATRFSQRVIIDPTLVADIDTTATALAKAIGASSDEIGDKIIWAMTQNKLRSDAIAAAKLQPAADPIELIEDEASVEPPQKVNGVYPTSLDDAGKGNVLKKPIRYLSLSELLTPEQVDAVREIIKDKKLKLKGLSLEQLPVREFSGGGEVANLVGLYGFGGVHKTGLEARRNKDLGGTAGKVAY
ncbi:MAG: hypothetical protein NTV94_09300, partial [Planctomycetota bacterium]|nr:hypothetical protein [Planctomycetota bacterium]